MLERTQKQAADSPVSDFVGQFVGSSFAQDKANVQLRWVKDDLSVAYLGEYISGLDNEVAFVPDYIQKVDAQYYSDITVSYTYDDTIGITAGINNLTDEAPPYIDSGFNASTDPSTYRMFGRGYFVRLSYSY